MLKMNASSKLNVSWDFFCYLHRLGREAASHWLDKNFDLIGVKSSVNIEEEFLGYVKPPAMKKKKAS